MTEHEIELKRLLLGDGAAQRLLTALGQPAPRPCTQVNHILDTPAFALRTSHCALRLRDEDGCWFLTAKGPSRGVGAFTGSRVEAEVTLDSAVAAEILKGQRDPIAELRQRLGAERTYTALFDGLEHARAGERLLARGSFQNLRARVPATLPSGLEIVVEIDRTSFPDGVSEQEVEIEVSEESLASEVEAWLTSVLEGAGIVSRPSRPKIVRFFEHGGSR